MAIRDGGPRTAQGAPKPDQKLSAHLESIDSIPLFMKALPQDAAEGGEADPSMAALDALQSLTFDGTPDEVALGFKKQGNDYFVGKRYTEARGFYTQALNAYPEDKSLKETLLVNRAACNLALDNHAQVLRDCSEALALNPKSTKAFFRSAKSLSALNRFVEALDCCDHALEIDPSNAEVRRLRQSIAERQEKTKRREEEVAEHTRRKKESKIALDKAFLSRGLWVETSSKPPDNPNPAHFDPEAVRDTLSDPSLPLIDLKRRWCAPDHIRTPVVFPVAFLYPQYAQSDFVSHFHEDVTVGDQLETMFPTQGGGPIPWDQRNEYQNPRLKVFASTHEQRLLRIGKKLTLREAVDHCSRDADPAKSLQRDGMVLQDGILSLIVVPEGDAERAWIERFKSERAARG